MCQDSFGSAITWRRLRTWLPHHSLTTEPFSAEKYYRDSEGMACMEIWVKPLSLKEKNLGGFYDGLGCPIFK